MTPTIPPHAKSRGQSSELAIAGGTPVRSEPLPWEFPGANLIGGEELDLVTRVIKAQSPFRYYGPNLQHMVDTFEAEWCQAFGHHYAVGVASGTAALSIAVGALEIGPGDEVLVPGLMWVSCVSAVVRAGAIPRLVDIDDTLGMDPDDLQRKIGPHTRAVICVHMSGAPGRIQTIAEICRQRGLALIEDCAQAAGASQHGQPVGTFGDIGIFSFQINKTLTSGEGGLVVTQRDELYKRIVAIHDLGYVRDHDGRLDTSSENYQLWGIGARMSELAGALALSQLRKLPGIVAAMRAAKWCIRRGLEDISGLRFREILDPAGDSGLALICTLPEEATCRRFVDALRAEGVAGPSGSLAVVPMREWGLHWYADMPSLVHKRSNSRDGMPWTHPVNAFATDYTYARGELPACDDMQSRGILLSIGPTYQRRDVDDIIAAFRKVAGVVVA